jgi:RNA polymerase sigma-70 factor, ECF subfamily
MSYGSATHPWPARASREWSVTVVAPATPTPAGASDLGAADDATLARLAAAGDRSAFDVVVERHRRTVYRVCFRFVGNHEDASDLAQDVFVRAWRGLARFKGDAALSTWLYRIAVNTCLNKVSARTPPTEPIGDLDRFADTHADAPGAELRRRERSAAVRRAIQALPRKQRATLILRAYHELPHQEIAGILGSSVGAVKANFFHALGNLKRILGSEP